MKNKKGIILIAILLSISLITAACANKVEEKIGEKVSEKALENATDGDVDVDVDSKDGVSIEMEGGSMKTGEDLGWPKENMGELPKPDAKVNSITEIEEENAVTVILSFNSENGGPEYMEELIDMGYIQDALSRNEMGVRYTGVKDDNTAVIFSYDPNETHGTIMYMTDSDIAKNHFEEGKEENEDEEDFQIDSEESMDWPEDSMDDIPELKAQINSVSISNESVSIGYEKVREKDIASYIKEIKSLGFDENTRENTMKDFISYSASNDEGNRIDINWTGNEGNINYIKQ